MRVLIYGAGVIGSIFAGKLALAGMDVTVLARGSRLAELEAYGIVLTTPGTGKTERAAVRTISSLEPEDRYDYIIVPMQRTQVDEVLPVLARNSSANIVLVVNTAGGYKHWEETLGKGRLMLGFPSAGGERRDGTVIYFVGTGSKRLFQTTTFGEPGGERTQRVKTLIRMFNEAGIPSVFSKDMDAWQKTHVAMVSSIANALYGSDCDNVRLGRSYGDVRRMVAGIQEGRRVLRAIGVRPAPGKLIWLDLPEPLLALIFALFLRTELANTTMAKHCRVAREEMACLQKEFDGLIASSGLKTPAIDVLRRNLTK